MQFRFFAVEPSVQAPLKAVATPQSDSLSDLKHQFESQKAEAEETANKPIMELSPEQSEEFRVIPAKEIQTRNLDPVPYLSRNSAIKFGFGSF